ncbi:MAG: response regulator [Candidatus Omnitrophica bacterium]|nr:response regulator [Candidatus Omnitrophota bacterium]
MFKRVLSLILSITFIFSAFAPYANAVEPLFAAPAVMPLLAPANIEVPLLKGLRIDPASPLKIDFILEAGKSEQNANYLKIESNRLIKYFLAGLTVPANELWVNLNPKEPNRITSEKFGQTEMGRDLLAQDYVLKQLSASLLNPDNETGRKFWDGVYKNVSSPLRGEGRVRGLDIPIGILSKVWIVPGEAVVVEKENAAYVKSAKLKVLFEGAENTQLIKQLILPAIEKQVNEGSEFSLLRQIYHSLILATWMKRKIGLLQKNYINQNKISGIDVADKQAKQKIYAQYLKAFTDGLHKFIKEEYDPQTRQIVARQYFTGGAGFENLDSAMVVNTMQGPVVAQFEKPYEVDVDLKPQNSVAIDQAALAGTLKMGKGIKGFLDRVFVAEEDKEKKERTRVLIESFLNSDFEPAVKMFEEINQLSNDKKIILARQLLKTAPGALAENLTLEQFLMLKPNDNNASFFHIFGRFILAFHSEYKAEYLKMYQGNPLVLNNDITRWKTVYALLWAAEILGSDQALLARQNMDDISRDLINKHQALSDDEIAAFEKELPNFNWRMATDVPWEEVIRSPSLQPYGPTDDEQSVRRWGSIYNQQNYWNNNVVVRRYFLFLVRDMILNPEFFTHDYVQRISQMHSALRRARGLYASDSGHDDGLQTGILNSTSEQNKKLFLSLKELLQEHNGVNKNLSKEISQIAGYYLALLQGYLFGPGRGNNSLYMNMVNALIRLNSLNGISHENLDMVIALVHNKPEKFLYPRFLSELKKRNPENKAAQNLSIKDILPESDQAMVRDSRDQERLAKRKNLFRTFDLEGMPPEEMPPELFENIKEPLTAKQKENLKKQLADHFMIWGLESFLTMEHQDERVLQFAQKQGFKINKAFLEQVIREMFAEKEKYFTAKVVEIGTSNAINTDRASLATTTSNDINQDDSWAERFASYRHKRIIVADDHADFRQDMQGILSRYFNKVTIASSINEVMEEYAAMKADQVADDDILILIDFQFAEGHNAFELVNQLRVERNFTGKIGIVSGSMVSELNIPGYDPVHQDLNNEVKIRYGLDYIQKQPAGFKDNLFGLMDRQFKQKPYQKPEGLEPLVVDHELHGVHGREPSVVHGSNLGYFLSGINDREMHIGEELEKSLNEVSLGQSLNTGAVQSLIEEIKTGIKFSNVRQGFNGSVDSYAFRQSLHDHKNNIARLGSKIEDLQGQITAESNAALDSVLSRIHDMVNVYFNYTDWVYRMLIYCGRLEYIEMMEPLLQSAIVSYQKEFERRHSNQFDPDEGIAQALNHLKNTSAEFRGQHIEPAMKSWGILFKEYQAVEEGMNKILGDKMSSNQNAFLKSFSDKLNLFFGQYLVTFGANDLNGDLPGKALGRVVVLSGDSWEAEQFFKDKVQESDIVVVRQDYSWITAARSKASAIIFAQSGGQHIITQARISGIPLIFLPNADEFFEAVRKEYERQGKNKDIFVRVEVEDGKGRIIPVNEVGEKVNPIDSLQEIQKVEVDKVDGYSGPDIISSESPLDDYADTMEELRPWMGTKALNQYIVKKDKISDVPQFLMQTFRLMERCFKFSDKYYEILDKIRGFSDTSSRHEVETVLKEMQDYIFSQSLNELDEMFYKARAIEWIFENPLAIRLITNDQDLEKYPGVGAGTYLSLENIRVKNVQELKPYLKEVYASMWSYEAYKQRLDRGIPQDAVYGAIEIQEYKSDAIYSMHIETQVEGNPDILKIMFMPGAARSISAKDPQYGGEPFIFYFDKKAQNGKGGLIGWSDPRTQYHPVKAEKAYYASFENKDPQSFNINNYPELRIMFKSKNMNVRPFINQFEDAARKAMKMEKRFQSPREIEATLDLTGFSAHQCRRMKVVGPIDISAIPANAEQDVEFLERVISELKQRSPEIGEFIEKHGVKEFDPRIVSGEELEEVLQGLRILDRSNTLKTPWVFSMLLITAAGGSERKFDQDATRILKLLQNKEFDSVRGSLMFLMAYFVFGGHEFIWDWLEYLSNNEPELFKHLAPYFILSDRIINASHACRDLMLFRLLSPEFYDRREIQKKPLREKFIQALSVDDISHLLNNALKFQQSTGSDFKDKYLLDLLKTHPDFTAITQLENFKKLYPEESTVSVKEPSLPKDVVLLKNVLEEIKVKSPAIKNFIERYSGRKFSMDDVSFQEIKKITVEVFDLTQSIEDPKMQSIDGTFLIYLIHKFGSELGDFEKTSEDICIALQHKDFDNVRAPVLFLISFFGFNGHAYMFRFLDRLVDRRPELFKELIPYFILSDNLIQGVYNAHGSFGLEIENLMSDRMINDAWGTNQGKNIQQTFINELTLEQIEKFLGNAVTIRETHTNYDTQRLLLLLQNRNDFKQITVLNNFKQLYPDYKEPGPDVMTDQNNSGLSSEKIAWLHKLIDNMKNMDSDDFLKDFLERHAGGSFDLKNISPDDFELIRFWFWNVLKNFKNQHVEVDMPTMFLAFAIYISGERLDDYKKVWTDILQTLQSPEFDDVRGPIMFLMSFFVEGGHEFILEWLDDLSVQNPDLFKKIVPYFIVPNEIVYLMQEQSTGFWKHKDFILYRLLFEKDAERRWGNLQKRFIADLSVEDVRKLMDNVEVFGKLDEKNYKVTLLHLIEPHQEFLTIKGTTEFKKLYPYSDQAQLADEKNKGGIDLNTETMNVKVESDSAVIADQGKFDQALLASIQSMTGFEPVIVSIRPLTNVNAFFGI